MELEENAGRCDGQEKRETIDDNCFLTSTSHVNRETIHAIKVTDAWCCWDRKNPPSRSLRVLAAELTGTIEHESEMTSEIAKDMGEFLKNIAVS